MDRFLGFCEALNTHVKSDLKNLKIFCSKIGFLRSMASRFRRPERITCKSFFCPMPNWPITPFKKWLFLLVWPSHKNLSLKKQDYRSISKSRWQLPKVYLQYLWRPVREIAVWKAKYSFDFCPLHEKFLSWSWIFPIDYRLESAWLEKLLKCHRKCLPEEVTEIDISL